MQVLLLAGTGEAREIAGAMAGLPGVKLRVSVARAARPPEDFAAPTRIGGFGGDDGFRRYLVEERIGAVLDATHPFAARVSPRSARICDEMSVPYCQVLRPPWTPMPGDRWHGAEDEAAAARLPPVGARVFVATGQHRLDRFGPMPGRQVFVRQIGSAPSEPPPFTTGEWVVGRPPFSRDAEVALFSLLGINWLILRNAGGAASRTKLDAARELGVDVAMIRRPSSFAAPRVETVPAALDWVRDQLRREGHG